MILLGATCARPLWETELLCQRPPGHDGAHVYHSSDVADGTHDDGVSDQ